MVLVFATSYLSANAQASSAIASIRAEVNQINKRAASFKKVTRDVEGLTTEGTTATYFTSGKLLKKIVGKMYGETFRATAELFYSGGQLIFAFQRLEKYDSHIAMDPPPKVVAIMETRVYYSGEKALRVIEDGKTLASRSSDFVGAEEGLLDLSNQLRAALASP